jgi:hypothetical protein
MKDEESKRKTTKRPMPVALKKEIERNVSDKKEWGSYDASIAKTNR